MVHGIGLGLDLQRSVQYWSRIPQSRSVLKWCLEYTRWRHCQELRLASKTGQARASTMDKHVLLFMFKDPERAHAAF